MRQYAKAKHLFIICFLILVIDFFHNYLILRTASESNAAYGHAYLWLWKTIFICTLLGILAISETVKCIKYKRSKWPYILGLIIMGTSSLLVIYGIPIPRFII